MREALRHAVEGDPSAARALLPFDRRMGTGIVEPTHLLRAKNAAEGVRVTLQVFRDLTWPVDFAGVRVGGEQSLYLIDLEHDLERWCSKVPA